MESFWVIIPVMAAMIIAGIGGIAAFALIYKGLLALIVGFLK